MRSLAIIFLAFTQGLLASESLTADEVLQAAGVDQDPHNRRTSHKRDVSNAAAMASRRRQQQHAAVEVGHDGEVTAAHSAIEQSSSSESAIKNEAVHPMEVDFKDLDTSDLTKEMEVKQREISEQERLAGSVAHLQSGDSSNVSEKKAKAATMGADNSGSVTKK